MDVLARRSNPTWARANDGARATYAIREAAETGRTLPLAEGQQTQIARHRMNGGRWERNAPFGPEENEALRVGYVRALHDAMSKRNPEQSVAAPFRKGIDAEEGISGMIGPMMNRARVDAGNRARQQSLDRGSLPRSAATASSRARARVPTAERFFENVEREHVAHSTQQAIKGNSVTGTIAANEAKRNAVMRMLATIKNNPNPMQLFTKGSEMMAERMGRGRDTEMARMLSTMTDDPVALNRVLDEISRTAPGTREGFAPVVHQGISRLAPTIGGQAGQRSVDPPPRRNNRPAYTIGGLR
jgi:hypothetical protein